MDLSSSLSFWEESVCHCYFHFLVLLPFNFLPWFFLFMFNVLIFLSGLSDRNLDHYFCTLPFIVNKPSMPTPSPMGETIMTKLWKCNFAKRKCSDILCTVLPLCDSSWVIRVLCVFLCACTHVFWSSWDSVRLTYTTAIYLWLPQCGFWVWGNFLRSQMPFSLLGTYTSMLFTIVQFCWCVLCHISLRQWLYITVIE